MTFAGSNARIVGTGRATLVLPMVTKIVINEVLLYPESKRSLLSFKDVRVNSCHVEIGKEHNVGYLLMTKFDGYQKNVVEKLPFLASGLHYTYIKPIEEYIAMKTIFGNQDSYRIWHRRLGHPGLSMMRKIITNSVGHNTKSKGFSNPEDFQVLGS